MAEWHVWGKKYRVQWAHPVMRENGQHDTAADPADESCTLVFVFDDAVPKNEVLDTLPNGDQHVLAVKAATAVGNVLKNRVRIEFLRLLKLYPYGMEPGAIGLDGGGDPRAHPNQRDKAKLTGAHRINAGLLLQPGAFAEPEEPINLRTAREIEDDRRERKGLPPNGPTGPTAGPGGVVGPDSMIFDDPGDGDPQEAQEAKKVFAELAAARFDTVNPPLSELPQRAARETVTAADVGVLTAADILGTTAEQQADAANAALKAAGQTAEQVAEQTGATLDQAYEAEPVQPAGLETPTETAPGE